MTALPLLAACSMLAAGLWRGRRGLSLPGWQAVLFILAAGVRLLWVPVQRHEYDGHEAEYLSWFLGERLPGTGDTLAYPMMQWWWWLWGALLPADPRLPVVISVLVGSLGVCLLAGLAGGRRAGLLAGVVAALHPEHAAWSSSAYNVILPHTLGAAAVLLVAQADRQRSGGLAWAAMGAGVLAVSGRLETIVYALPCALLVLRGRCWQRWFGPVLAGLVVGAACVWPVLGAGPLPGAEERGQSLALNLPLLVFHAPFHRLLPLAALGALAVGAWRRDRAITAAVLALAVGNHVLMSSFDDYGARHALPALVAICWCAGAGAAGLGRPGGLAWGVLVATAAVGMADLRTRYYAPEESFAEVLAEAPWSSLPRVSERPGRGAGCGWIAEDPRVADEPARSHFNLYNPAEVEILRGAEGCLYWCVDAQDWRWSSRGVRDRARRLEKMYVLRPTSVVVEQSSGYSCLVMWVGERGPRVRRAAAEWHGRGHPADSFLP